MTEQMAPPPDLYRLFGRLWAHIDRPRRGQLGLLLLLMIFASFAEALSIGAVLPFLGALTQPEIVFDRPSMQAVLAALGLHSPSEILLPLTILFGVVTVLAGASRVLLLWVSTRLSFAIGSDLSNKVYRTTLHQSYTRHISRNSSEVVNAIWTKVSEVIFFVLLPLMTVVSSIIIIAVVCAVLFAIIPAVALLAFVGLAAVYGLFVKVVKRRLSHNSEQIATDSSNLVRTLQEGLGGIRDVIIDASQEAFAADYRTINARLRRAQGENQIISQSPRYVVEAAGMLLIAVLAYAFSRESSVLATTIPMLAAMALGMQRLLPAAQQLYGAWSNIYGTRASLQDAMRMLDEPSGMEGAHMIVSPLTFARQIELKDVSFRYDADSAWIVDGVSLRIARGARIGFFGPTGCGKSTLLDIVMALLQPSYGTVEIDGVPVTAANARTWQLHIAHVPQAVFLADSTIAKNIAFGLPDDAIDLRKVERAAAQAQLADLIASWPRGYRTRVGERGVQLSGGQRQRIGIARALYKNADVIVFDEATSALDNETEQAVVQAIEALRRDITILVIAHRMNTLRGCNEIIELRKGAVVMKRATSVEVV